MTVKELNKMLKGGVLPRVGLFFGEEEFYKASCAKKIQDAFADDPFFELNVFRFEGKNYSTADVENAVESLPVMAERKLLYFSGSALFQTAPRGAKQDVKDYWDKRLRDVPDYCHILFDESAVDKRSGLYKLINKNFTVCEFQYLSENELNSWAVKLFSTFGKKLSAVDAQYLISLCDEGMHNIKREAEKLAAYTDGKTEIARADIDAVVVPSVRNKVFDMVDAVFARNNDRALVLLNDLFILREPEMKIMGAVNYQLDRLLSVKLLMMGGTDRGGIISKLKLPPFAAGKYMKTADGRSLSAIEKMVTASSETDLAMKDNSIDNRTLLELFIIKCCAA